jgi:hypothetical protein
MLDMLPVSSVKKYISKMLPQGWENFETETILMELGVMHSDLLVDKINLIRVFEAEPLMFYEDPMFFYHACEVFNGNVTDFYTLPHITSLEAALAIVDASRLLGCEVVEQSPAFSLGVRLAIREILVEDGYSAPVWPFDVVGITNLSEGATNEDMANKSRAIKEYIQGSTGGKPTGQ